MLLSCSLGLSISLAVMGVCYQIDDWQKTCEADLAESSPSLPQANVTAACSYGLGLLPIVTSMVYIFMFNIGYGSLVWMTATEILPAHIRSSTNGLTVGWTGVMSFLTTFSFPWLLQSRLGGQGCFGMYSAVSFLGFVFIGFFVPETSGKTEEEISKLFQNKETSNSSKENVQPSPIIKTQDSEKIKL